AQDLPLIKLRNGFFSLFFKGWSASEPSGAPPCPTFAPSIGVELSFQFDFDGRRLAVRRHADVEDENLAAGDRYLSNVVNRFTLGDPPHLKILELPVEVVRVDLYRTFDGLARRVGSLSLQDRNVQHAPVRAALIPVCAGDFGRQLIGAHRVEVHFEIALLLEGLIGG